MSWERFTELVTDLCDIVGLHDPKAVIDRRMIDVEGFDVMLDHVENDLGAMYMNFHYGTVTAGRTLVVFRLMLEANLLVYAQDQAQLGLDADTGGIILIVRIPFGPGVSGEWLVDLLGHYAEHGRYWRKNILESTDEMFEGIATGEFLWIRS
ncbi:molecular chaperone Tir [Paraburkholderia sp. BR13439]|uniref:molecular chaperone Tir n=1 Tax=Paraburkholderia TaxID=1822464 RepID=UPI0034CF3097